MEVGQSGERGTDITEIRKWLIPWQMWGHMVEATAGWR